MVVSVEISGVLEKRLRRLVDLGLYSSVAEAVRDAVKLLFEKVNLRDAALNLYTSRDVSLNYAAEISGEPLESFIDYMVSKGVAPVLGALTLEDVGVLEGEVLLDPSSTFVVYKSLLYNVALKLSGENLKLYAPRALAPQIHVWEALRVRRGLPAESPVNYVTVEPVESEDTPLLTGLERGVLRYASKTGLTLLSDDHRVRLAAEALGVKALSSLSLIATAAPRGGISSVGEVILSLKAIPVLIPPELERRWLKGVW